MYRKGAGQERRKDYKSEDQYHIERHQALVKELASGRAYLIDMSLALTHKHLQRKLGCLADARQSGRGAVK